jgi:hypothetical protein
MLKVVANIDDRLEAIADEIAGTQKSCIYEIGKLLSEAQEIFRYRKNEEGFVAWLKNNVDLSQRSAYNSINSFKLLNNPDVCNKLQTLSPTVLSLISSKSTKDHVREEVLKRIEKGKRIKVDDVKRLNEEAKQARDEAALSATKKKNLKAKREKERLDHEREEAESLEKREKVRIATQAAVDLVVEIFGDRFFELQALLKESHYEMFYQALVRAE